METHFGMRVLCVHDCMHVLCVCLIKKKHIEMGEMGPGQPHHSVGRTISPAMTKLYSICKSAST